VYTLEVSNDDYFTVSKELVVDQNSKVTEANGTNNNNNN
jgi:hypothetical protein